MVKALLSTVTVIPKSDFSKCLPMALQIMRDIDEDDTEFVALALSLGYDGIWSDDRDFQRQKEVRIWRTRELIDLI